MSIHWSFGVSDKRFAFEIPVLAVELSVIMMRFISYNCTFLFLQDAYATCKKRMSRLREQRSPYQGTQNLRSDSGSL